jgi:hypothetical protein
MRARYFFDPHFSDPPGDARPAPHSAAPGLRRADPLRPAKPTSTAKPTKRPDLADPAARRASPHRASPHRSFPLSTLWISLSALWGERASPGRDPGAGVRWGLPQTDWPAPLTLPSPAGRRGARPKGASLAPNAATTAPAPRFRAGAAPRPGTTPHPEN